MAAAMGGLAEDEAAQAPARKDALTAEPDVLPDAAIDAAACAACHSPVPPKANFCPECGGRLPAGRRPTDPRHGFRAERRRVTILFCDLVNSVALAAGRDPEDVADVMRRFHATLASVMERFGGYIERPMGDGGLFYFGYPAAAEDDCERAIEAALEAIDIIDRASPQLGVRLQVRIGIAAGVVLVGDILGAADHGGHDVVGDVANLAARLQQSAEPGTALVSDAVHKLTRGRFDFEDAGAAQLRGWPGAMQIWRPLRATPYSDRFGERLSAGASPIIGREAELAELSGAWERARAGYGQVVLVIGESGIGKSRLAHELTRAVIPPDAALHRYLCGRMQRDVPLHPFIERLAHVAGLADGDAPETRLAKLMPALGGLPESDVTLIADLVAPGTAAGRPSVREASPDRQRGRILDALLANLLRLAARKPLVIVFEDAHWSDPTTRELLARIAGAAPGRRLLVVITARPQFRPEWSGAPGVCRVDLDPLTAEASARLVRSTSGASGLADDVVAEIVERSDGVPLYIEEVTRGALAPGGGDREVPASIHASLLSRIDGLGRARFVAEVAATIGRAFDLALLAAVCEAPEAELSDALDRLIASGLVQRSDASGRRMHVFRHALIRDTTYGTIVRARRRALHGRIAEALERDFPTDAATQPQLLALHLSAAGQDLKAAEWWLRAGLQSLQRSAMEEALTHLRRALALLEALPEDAERHRAELDVLVVYGKVLMATQGHASEATGAVLVRSRALCEALGEPPQLLSALFGLWTHYFFRVQLDDAKEQARDLLDRATRRGENMWHVMGCYTLGFTTILRGDIDAGMGLLEQGIARYDPALRHLYAGPTIGDPRVVMRTYLGWGHMMRGAFSGAERELAAAVQEARDLGQSWALALALTHQVYAVLLLRGPEAAWPLLDELIRVANGVEYYMTVAAIERGWHLAASGEVPAGLEVAREGRRHHATTGSRLHLPNYLRYEADMLLRLGRAAEALESIEAGKAVQAASREEWDDAEFHRQRGEAFAALGRLNAAEAELGAARRVAAERGQHLFGLRATVSLAGLLAARGEQADGAAMLTQARALVEDDPGVLDVAAADRLLARLAPTG